MITEKIDSALSAVFEHFYSYMPEFEDGEEPEKYAVYNLSYRDTFFSYGKYTAVCVVCERIFAAGRH